MRRFYAFIPVVLILGLIGWRISEKRAEQTANAGQMAARSKSAPSVSVAPVQVRDIIQSFNATGDVEAPLNVKISPKLAGRVSFIQAHEGDRVKKGQVLVRIDDTDVEAGVRAAQASVAEAQYRLAQAQLTQNSTNVGVNTQIRQQKAVVASSVADYNQVKQNYQSQLASASASVVDAQGKIDVANAAISNAQAAIDSAQANLDNARAKYNRIQGLYKQGFIAAQDVDDAKAAVSVQSAAFEVAKGQLRAANAQRDSAVAQKQSAEQQASIVKTKGLSDIEASKAKLVQAQASSEYAQANTSQKSAYQQSIAALRSAVDAAKAELRSAESKRADTVLVSPLDGYVTGRYVDPGAVLSAGQAALAVQFMKQVWVTIAVPEESVPKLHIGQPAKVAFDAFQGQSFAGSIIQINPSADPLSRQFTVRAIMDNSQGLFKTGMFGHVSVQTERIPNSVVIPREALQRDRIGQFAMVVNRESKAERRELTLGASDADYIAVTQGVRPGEKVIVMSASPVRDGQAVKTGKGKGKGKRGGPDAAGAQGGRGRSGRGGGRRH